MLKVKEIFGPTLQGEGSYTGTVACFVRMSGCNMWNGKPESKEASACPYCDTDFFGGTMLPPNMVAQEVFELMKDVKSFIVVVTGGEPLLQKYEDLVALAEKLRELASEHGKEVAVNIETNGTVSSPALDFFDHVVCSPKLPADKCKIQWDNVDELKLLYPHPNPEITPESFMPVIDHYDLRGGLFIQPISGKYNRAVSKVIELGCGWRLSVQIQKVVGVE